jgi:hypothetical protein
MRKIGKVVRIKDPLTVYELRIAILGDDIAVLGERHDPE